MEKVAGCEGGIVSNHELGTKITLQNNRCSIALA